MKYKLEDICIKITDGSHFSPKDNKNSVIPMYSVKDMREFNFDMYNCKHISEEDYIKLLAQDCVPKKNDILVAKDGSYLKEIFVNEIEDKKAILSSIAIFRPNLNIVNPYFLCYLLKSPEISNYTKENCVSGSAIPRIVLKDFKKIELDIPEICIQNKIVKILKKINEKIIANTHTNNNLYEILDNIFKEKYLNNERYNSWEEVTLDDITSKFATGLNPRKNFVLGHGSNYYVTIKNMQNNNVILNDKCDKIDDEAILKINRRSDLKVGDLLFSGIGTIGRVYLIKDVPYNWNISESIFTIRPNEKCSSEFLYLLLLNKNMQNYAVNKASGSVQKGIRKADLKQFKVKLPTNNEMQDFTDIIKPIIDRIYNKTKQNEKLEIIRDTLLPKLMNGKIDLDKIEI